MQIQLSTDWLIGLLLIATRFAGVFLMLPVLGMASLPPRVRVLLVLALSLIVGLALPQAPHIAHGIGGLMQATVFEFAFGALMAFGIHTAMAALSFAGQLLDFQIGFNAAALFDFNTEAQNPLLSRLFGMFGAVVFVALDAHHELLRLLASTFTTFQPGTALVSVDMTRLVRQFGIVFLYGFVIASPVVLGLFLLDAATAFISRTMPQLNIYFVSLPLKIFWGLLLLTLTLMQAGPLLSRLFEQASAGPVAG